MTYLILLSSEVMLILCECGSASTVVINRCTSTSHNKGADIAVPQPEADMCYCCHIKLLTLVLQYNNSAMTTCLAGLLAYVCSHMHAFSAQERCSAWHAWTFIWCVRRRMR